MNLKRLDDEAVEKIGSGNLVIVGSGDEYLREIYSEFPGLPVPICFLNDYERRWGIKEFRNRDVDVVGFEKIRELPENTTFLMATGFYDECYGKLLPYGIEEKSVSTIYYYANQNTKYYEEYLEKYKETPLKDLMVFRSGPGMSVYVRNWDYADNARAMFEYMVQSRLNEKWELVWLVKNPDEFREIEEKYENVSFLSFDWAVSQKEDQRNAYYRALCLAKYFFFTEACAFCRYPREGQVRVQLWHGSGFKARTSKARFEYKCEYHTVSSKFYADVHKDVLGFRPDQILITGNAKDDWIYHPVENWNDRLCIPKAGHYLFWLPTFRTAVGALSVINDKPFENSTGIPIVNNEEEFEQLNNLLKEIGWILVIKLHPVQDADVVAKVSYENICFLENEKLLEENIAINQVLGHADALISDYSSVAVDYLLLDRPLAFTTDDLDEYEKNRGFVFSPIRDYLPGEEINNFSDMIAFVRAVASGEDPSCEKRRRLSDVMHAFHSEGNCMRIAKALGIIGDE